jgi:hypothetical protein
MAVPLGRPLPVVFILVHLLQDPLSEVDNTCHRFSVDEGDLEGVTIHVPVQEGGGAGQLPREEPLLGGAVHVPRDRGATQRDDDCESGHGPSLPMSPHSGATGMYKISLFCSSVMDPESDPVRSETFCMIRNKSFWIRIRAALIQNEFETKLL